MFAARRAMFGGSVPPPTYVSVSPASGRSGNTVTITGTNFIAGNTTVHFNNVLATSVNVTSSTSLTCVVPAATTSNNTAIPIKITTPSGSVTTGNVYTFFVAPTITSFNPGSRTANTSGNVTINGTNFVSGQTSVSVNGGGYGVTFNSATQLTVGFPALGRGTYSVVVTTPGGSASANYAYTIIPTITSVSPNQPWVNTNYNFTVTGTNFISSGANGVYTDGAGYQYKGATINSDTSLTYNATYTATGTYRVDVTAPDGWSNQSSVTVINKPVPTVSSVSDGRSGNGSLTGSTISVSGSNFSGASVSIGGTAVSASVSASSISFACPNLGSDGTKTISISTSAGSTSTSVYFWAARGASTVVNATSGSGSYTPPQWANFLDVTVRGGGGGGGSGSGGLQGRWGGGGSAGGASGGTINLVSAGFGARSWSVGGGGAGALGTVTTAGGGGGTSSAAGYSAGGGAGGCTRCNGGAGANGVAFQASPAPTGGGGGNSSQPGANPGSGGGGGNSALGPFPGIAGRGGAVIMVIRQ